MTEICVHNCTVRVVRRGGWSWGANPGRLLDGVLAAVPALIADALAAGVAEGTDTVVREPVRIAVPLRTSDLAALARVDHGGAGEPGRVAAGLTAALTLAFQDALAERGVSGHAPAATRQGAGITGTAARARPPGPATLRLLLAWERDGLLSELLGRLPEPVLAAWHDALVKGWQAPPAAAPEGAELAEALAGGAAGVAAGPDGERAGWLRRRLAALTAVAARTGLAPCQPEVLVALEDWLGPPPLSRSGAAAIGEAAPYPAAARSSPGQVAAQPEVLAALEDRLGPPPPSRPGPAAIGEAAQLSGSAAPSQAAPCSPARPPKETRISSALPFLILVPLARTGWLDTLAVAVEAAELTDHWPSLAAAIAFKVLSPPEDGWRRSPEDLAAAAAFAGIAGPLVEGALPAGARLLAPPLDAVLGRSLVDGHRPGAPLVLTSAGRGDGLVLLDGEGLFPMAWADDAAGLASWLHACADARIVPGPGAGTGPEAQEEPGDQELLRRADLVLAELGRRPALPVAAEPDLERSLTLSAGAGLAAIAWTLWGEHEPTDPVLAIDRLASLSATVRYGDERVSVVIPLGARYFDLQRHGLLGEVREVPWLDGRTIEIVGG